MKILMTGSRTWIKRGPVEALMSGLLLQYVDAEFVIGDEPNGLDAIALQVCRDLWYQHKLFVANWNLFGLAAGPKRNSEMVSYAARMKSAVGFAFRMPGISKGTDDCTKQAIAAGIPMYTMSPGGM